jgi:hypothetical protein
MGLVLVVLLVGVGIWLLRRDPAPDCAVRVESGDARPQLVPRATLLPSGSEGSARRGVVEAVEGLGGPVGSVVSGRFFERLTARPSVLAYGDRLALVSAPRSGGAALDVVDPADAGTDWHTGLSSDPAWTSFTGGPVGEDLVLAFSGADPTVLSLADDAQVAGCHALPRAGTVPVQVRTDQAGADVVVATVGGAERVVRLLDPVSGKARWSATSSGPLASVTVAGDLVLLARADSATVATNGLPVPAPGPWLEALSLGEGEPLWSAPPLGGRAASAASDQSGPLVLLTAGADGTSYALEVGDRGSLLVALDARGDRLWSRRAPEGFTSAWLWEDRLVLRGPDPAGGPMLRAFDTATGRPAWQVRARQAPGVGDDPRPGFASPLVEEGTAWVAAPNGLLEVDVATGRTTRHDSTAPVDQLFRVGDSTVVVSGTAVLLTR